MAVHSNNFWWSVAQESESPMREAMKLMKPEEIRVLAAAAARVIEARKAIVVEAKAVAPA